MGQREELRLARKVLEAEGYLQLGMPNEALEALDGVKVTATFAFEFHLLHGLALRDLERHDEAVEALERAAGYRRDDSTLCVTLGWCLKRTGRLAEAIEVLHRAQQAHPSEALLQYNLACYYSLSGERASAVSWLRNALELSPEMREMIPEESDFDGLKGDPEFEELAGGPYLA